MLSFHPVSSRTEFCTLISRIILIMTTIRDSNPAVFAQLLRCTVQATAQSTSHSCKALQFAFLIQDTFLM